MELFMSDIIAGPHLSSQQQVDLMTRLERMSVRQGLTLDLATAKVWPPIKRSGGTMYVLSAEAA
jgi:hypothetical protein